MYSETGVALDNESKGRCMTAGETSSARGFNLWWTFVVKCCKKKWYRLSFEWTKYYTQEIKDKLSFLAHITFFILDLSQMLKINDDVSCHFQDINAKKMFLIII